MNLYEQIAWDEAGEEMDRLREEVAFLAERVAELEELVEVLEDDPSNSKRKAFWRIACESLEYEETCNKHHAVPLIHDINIRRAKLNAARRKGTS